MVFTEFKTSVFFFIYVRNLICQFISLNFRIKLGSIEFEVHKVQNIITIVQKNRKKQMMSCQRDVNLLLVSINFFKTSMFQVSLRAIFFVPKLAFVENKIKHYLYYIYVLKTVSSLIFLSSADDRKFFIKNAFICHYKR